MIELQAVTKVYRQGGRLVEALRGVSLQVASGEFLALMGPSGSGKSTLLHLMGTLDTPTSGKVLLKGNDLRNLSDRERSLLRRSRIGFVFQFFNLLPALTAEENVALPLMLAGQKRKSALMQARAVLEWIGLSHRAGHRPPEMSGGEAQRVAIARALAPEPELILCDEPTGNLDSASGRNILELLRGLPEPGRRSIVLITHDSQAAAYGDRTIRLCDGRIESEVAARRLHAAAV